MRSSLSRTLCIGFLFFPVLTHTAWAGLDIGILPTYKSKGSSVTQETTSSVSANVNYNLPIAANFVAGGKWLVGYTLSTATGADAISGSSSALGGNLGWVSSDRSWHVIGFFLYSPMEKVWATTPYTRYGGTGYGLECSYLIKGNGISIGPKLTYLVRNFKKESTGETSSDLNAEQVDSQLLPYVSVVIEI